MFLWILHVKMAGGQPLAARDSAARRRLRSWLKHERLTVAISLAESLHHSAQRPEKARAREVEEQDQHEALQRQTVPPPGKRPEPLEEVSEPQAGIRRHTGVGFELVLDSVVPQLGREDERQVAEEWVELVAEHTGNTYLLLEPGLERHVLEPSEEEEEEEEEEKDSSDLFLTLHSWPRLSPTPAVACSWLVFFCARSVPFVRWQAQAARHHCRYGTVSQSSSPSPSTLAVAYSRLVLLVAFRAVFFPVVDRLQMLRIMACMDPKDCIPLFGISSRCFSFPPVVRPRCSASRPAWTRRTFMQRSGGRAHC